MPISSEYQIQEPVCVITFLISLVTLKDFFKKIVNSIVEGKINKPISSSRSYKEDKDLLNISHRVTSFVSILRGL